MRVDKFLWSVRYFKTRSIATNACKQGKVKMNASNMKPSKEVFPGDRLLVRKNQIDYQLEVLDLPPSRVGAKLVTIYIQDHTPKEAFEKGLSQSDGRNNLPRRLAKSIIENLLCQPLLSHNLKTYFVYLILVSEFLTKK